MRSGGGHAVGLVFVALRFVAAFLICVVLIVVFYLLSVSSDFTLMIIVVMVSRRRCRLLFVASLLVGSKVSSWSESPPYLSWSSFYLDLGGVCSCDLVAVVFW